MHEGGYTARSRHVGGEKKQQVPRRRQSSVTSSFVVFVSFCDISFFFNCKKKDDNTTHVSESRTWNFFSPPRVLLKSRPRNAATFFSGKTWESNYGLPLFLFLFLTAG